jgi:hypothetical protein
MKMCLYARVIAATLMVLAGSEPLAAQSPQGQFDRMSIEVEPMREIRDVLERQPLVPRRIPPDLALSERLKLIDRPVITMPDGRALRLPLDLNVVTSRDNRTVVQYGDALMRMHPVRTDLFWIGEDGNVRAEIRNRFDGKTVLDMSDDGYLAVVGGAFLSEVPRGEPKPKTAVIYSPAGEVIAEARIGPETEVAQIVSLPRGSGGLMAAAPTGEPLVENRLLLLRDGEIERLEDAGFGLLQKLVGLGRNGLVFVQGSNAYGLVDAAEGAVLWRNPGGIRLVGPQAAALDPSGAQLFLMTGERVGSDALYAWTLTILDAGTGEGLGQRAIEGRFPGVSEPVFTELTEDSAVIAPGGNRMRLSIRPR